MSNDHDSYWTQNPQEWIENFLGVRLWAKQVDIAQALVDHNNVTVRSGHGVGKSFVSACIVLWYLFTHYGSKIITTAPSFEQCRMILWSEIGKLHEHLRRKIRDAGHITTTSLKLGPAWWATARSTDKPNNFIGAHEENLLIIFDEASGIPTELFDAASGLSTGISNKILIIGNPTEPGSYFHRTHTGDVPGFHKIRISVFDCPNLRQNPKTKQWEDNIDPVTGKLPYPSLTSLAWVEKMRRTYGERSNAWSAKVLGEFPETAVDSLISGKHLAVSVQKYLYLRKVIDELEDGSVVLSSTQIQEMVGRQE